MEINTALWWLFLNILSAVVLAFFSMEEMACVSFNRLRLHYYVSKKMKRALWLNYLLQHPARLFGTTLFFVNLAMFVGSECSRQFYLALGFNPDFAPITQVIFIVIFAELAPMFAARRYAEHAALIGAPILYFSARAITPLLWSINLIAKFGDLIIGKKGGHEEVSLNQEDLQRILAQDEASEGEGDEFNAITRNIFSFRHKMATDVLQPMNSIALLPSNASVAQVRDALRKPGVREIPIYQRDTSHIVGIIHPRDVLRVPDTKRVRDYASAPWFITQRTGVIHILKDFRRNNRNVAIVINDQGLSIGIITLEDLAEEIFGKLSESGKKKAPTFLIDRSFPGDLLVGEFNKQFDVVLDKEEDLTLAELMARILGRQPELSDTVYIPPFELEVTEASLMEVKKVTITTRLK